MRQASVSREELVRRFEAWLDGVLAAEEPPAGIDADLLEALAAGDPDAGDPDASDGRAGPPDTYTSWAAMTALTHEVKLQGRAFKELHDVLGARAGAGAGDRGASHERAGHLDTERRCRREMLSVLIDLRDRLTRGLESVRAAESARSRHTWGHWLARIQNGWRRGAWAEMLTALTTGYELSLDRLDQTLGELNAHEIRGEGQPFDPRRMNAIDKQASGLVPEGTVLEVYRSGFEWNGEIVRPAQVKVSCAAAGHRDE